MGRSHRRGLKEGLLYRLLQRAPYRCRACGRRFVSALVPGRSEHRSLASYLGIERGPRQAELESLLVHLLVAGLFILFGLYLVRSLTAER